MNVLATTNVLRINSAQAASDLRIFCHHIYEYKKEVRNLILTTEKASNRGIIESRLQNEKIDYVIQEVTENKINVFFGAKNCIEVVKTFVNKKLNELTPEQDFMLGIMLGYGRLMQCRRYLEMKKGKVLSFKKGLEG